MPNMFFVYCVKSINNYSIIVLCELIIQPRLRTTVLQASDCLSKGDVNFTFYVSLVMEYISALKLLQHLYNLFQPIITKIQTGQNLFETNMYEVPFHLTGCTTFLQSSILIMSACAATESFHRNCGFASSYFSYSLIGGSQQN